MAMVDHLRQTGEKLSHSLGQSQGIYLANDHLGHHQNHIMQWAIPARSATIVYSGHQLLWKVTVGITKSGVVFVLVT